MAGYEYPDRDAYLLDEGLSALAVATRLPLEDRAEAFIDTAARFEEAGYPTEGIMRAISRGAQTRREIENL